MGEVDWCEVFWITYQSFLRTIVEGLFCFFIVAAYVPQYIAIVSQGTFGVSSRYILFHALFSIFTLSVRVCYPIYYDAYNCVDGGPYTGWKALSSLLGMIQAVVQCLCAIVLLGLYIHYRRCDDNGVSGDQTEEVTSLPPETSPLIMGLAVGFTGLVVLSVSFTFLIMNQNEMFDPDDGPIGPHVFVYRFLIHIWVFPLILANLAFLVLPVFYQVKTVQALHSHGSLSLISLGMQAFAFTVLAVLQTARDWRSILWPELPIYNKGLSDNLVGLEWNIHGPNSGTVPGIYDVHVRIGGAVNTDLQVAQCPQGKGISCRAGLLIVHITPHGGGYFQNIWAWVADHDIDDDFNDRVNVLVARGWLVESTEPLWLYGTATEHAVMYQYSFSSASTVSAGMIQTESGYFQGSNGVRNPAPFTGSSAISFPGDPTLPSEGCVNGTIGCDEAWAVVMFNSTNINIDGAGLYSWFNSYDESCVDSLNCQESMVQIGGDSGNVSIKNLITIGSERMVTSAPGDDSFLDVAAGPNLNAMGHPWWSILASFEIQNTLKTTVWPAHRSFFGLGDSYASGIGADCSKKIHEDEPKGVDCAKYQLANRYAPFNGDGEPGTTSSLFKFYACAGAKTSGIVDPPAPGKVSQIRQMRDYGNFRDFGFATLSIGGNNVGFSRIILNCVFWHTDNCDEEWERAELRVSSQDLVANLTQTYRQILDTAEEPTFKLFVTGYARFFNEYTDWCNDLLLFPNIFKGPRTALTRKVRARANKLTEELNAVIQKTTATVAADYQRRNYQKSVIFVDTDRIYNAQRWCDGTYRSTWRDDTYFFNAFSKDLKRDGTTAVDTDDVQPHVIDIGGINVNTCMDAADEAGDDEYMTRCAIAMVYADNSTLRATLGTVYPSDDGSGPSLQIIDSGTFTVSNIGTKAFHPKTYPLTAVAGNVYQAWIKANRW